MDEEAREAKKLVMDMGLKTLRESIKLLMEGMDKDERIEFLSSICESMDKIYESAWDDLHKKAK